MFLRLTVILLISLLSSSLMKYMGIVLIIISTMLPTFHSQAKNTNSCPRMYLQIKRHSLIKFLIRLRVTLFLSKTLSVPVSTLLNKLPRAITQLSHKISIH